MTFLVGSPNSRTTRLSAEFQDFSMTFQDNILFQDFPEFSRTVGTLADTIGAPRYQASGLLTKGERSP